MSRLVQDIIDHCETEGLEGFILFCDQHRAYDRVSRDFMQRVLSTMNLPDEFSRLTELLYSESEIRMKINGHIGAPHPTSNGVRQGCGLSPLLYILVFQSLLSPINTSHLFNDPKPSRPSEVSHFQQPRVTPQFKQKWRPLRMTLQPSSVTPRSSPLLNPSLTYTNEAPLPNSHGKKHMDYPSEYPQPTQRPKRKPYPQE